MYQPLLRPKDAMVPSTISQPGVLVILLAFVVLHRGLALNIVGKPASQSTTFENNADAQPGLAVDGDRTTTSHTECSGYQWWKVDLEATYCLTTITIANRADYHRRRLQGAVVRAGLNSDHTQNTQIGSAVTNYQAVNVLEIGFGTNPSVAAQYVSVELTGNCLHMAEVMVTTETSPVTAGTVSPVTQSAATPTSVTVSWSPVSCAVHYNVMYALTNKDGCEQINSPMYRQHCMCQGSQTTISGLLSNSQYIVKVKASVNGAYGPEAQKWITTDPVAPRAQPTTVEVSSVGQRNLTFTWNPLLCRNRGGVITGYKYMLINLNSRTNITGTVTGEEVVFDQLIPFTSYSFQVAATNAAETGPYSDAVNTRTEQAEPTVPLNVQIQSVDNISVILEWSEPDPPNGVITHYNVRYWRIEESDNVKSDVNVTELTHRVTDLQASATYQFQVQATTSAGAGPWSEAINATTAIGVPGPIRNLTYTERTETSVSLSWKPPLKPGGIITAYIVAYRFLERHSQPELTAEDTYHRNEAQNSSFLQDKLIPGTKYEFRVSARNEMFNGTYDQVLDVYTKPVTDLPPPTPPETYPNENTDTTVTIGLATLVSHDTDVSSYVVHIKKTSPSKAKREALNVTHYEDSPDDYIAAEISKQNLSEKFIVGDNQTYGMYRNAPLQTGASYEIRVGSVSRGNENEIFVSYSQPISVTVRNKQQSPSPSTTAPPSSAVVPAVVAVLVIVAIGLLITIVVYKRRRSQQAKKLTDIDGKQQPANIYLKTKGLTSDELERPEESSSHPHINVIKVVVTPQSSCTKKPKPSPKPRQKQTNSSPTTPALVEPKPFTSLPPVRIKDLAEYIRSQESKSEKGFEADYKSLPDSQLHPWTVASKPENRQKNRYVNVVAYDYSRIVLEPLEGDPHSDYINACYIDGYKKENKYIASQGPNKASLRDIWRMVWQLDVDKIVMLTNPVENGKVKCMRYWADTGTASYADIVVTTDKEEVFLDYTIRDFSIHQVGIKDRRFVRQFHYTTWPDMKPPEYPTPLLNFMRVVNAEKNPGRTVIHCSAGVGRTGTYIALDAMLEQMAQEEQVDVLGFIYQMRQKRIKMVQTPEQYKFIFDALLASSLTGDTTYNADDFRQKLSLLKKVEGPAKETGMSRQFETLGKLSVSPYGGRRRSKAALTSENVDKNRFRDLVPTDRARPYLMTRLCDDDSDYINANFLPGYCKKNRYIGTQMPMPNTVADFWRMVYDHKATTIVMLNTLVPEDKTMSCYWPQEGQIDFGPLVIELNETTEYKGVTGRAFTLKMKDSDLESEDSWVVTQFQYHDWPSDMAVPSSFDGMLTLLELTQGCHEDMKPIVVHCNDGYGATSVYCALMAMLDQFKFEKAVDVFQAAHRLRMANNSMMYSEHHYAMCYDVFQAHLNSATIYENYAP
ncbi:receptor-type tyrosine-protein phosphatase delta-like [Acanthaster planci]|uniref:protein-tyrosine-phosphatase n=1 Tax=Acanthaster planci TaxID=133434 RepID=A0A8B7YX32_ACAPL|nr:receptor-type tyrosine-protein phosphatase delta-like [Acanthaster planci]XP_022097248.1 receptor-type tyrosine-protein phosphatase delta-like [Acanthaster planci]